MATSILFLLAFPISADPGSRSAQPDATTAAFIAREKEFWRAYRDQDEKGLRLAADFFSVLESGVRHTRSEFLEMMKDWILHECTQDRFHVTPLGSDAGLVNYRWSFSGYFCEAHIGHTELFVTTTWVRRNGQWYMVFFQETVIGDRGRHAKWSLAPITEKRRQLASAAAGVPQPKPIK
jgi:hypothetical protein